MASIAREALHALSGQGAGKFVAVGAWTVLLSWVAQRLDKIEFGMFMLLVNIVTFAVIFAGFGQPQVILYVNGRLGKKYRGVVHFGNLVQSMRVIVPAALLVSLLTGCFVAMTLSDAAVASAAIACTTWVLFTTWQNFLAEEAKTISKFWLAGFLGTSGGVGGAVATSVTLGILITWDAHGQTRVDLLASVVALAAGAALSATMLIGWLIADWRSHRERERAHPRGPLRLNDPVRLGAVATMNAGLTFIVGYSDLWFVSANFGLEQSGVYGMAAYLARFGSLISILMSAAFANRFAGMLARGEVIQLSLEVRRIALIASSGSLVVLFFLLITFETGILSTFFRLQGNNAYQILIVLAIGHLIGSLFGFGPVLLGVAGRFSDLLKITVVTAAITLVLAVLLSNHFGTVGVAIAYSAGYVLFTYICHRSCRLNLRISPFSNLQA